MYRHSNSQKKVGLSFKRAWGLMGELLASMEETGRVRHFRHWNSQARNLGRSRRGQSDHRRATPRQGCARTEWRREATKALKAGHDWD